MNDKCCHLREATAEKDAVRHMKEKLERKKKEYLQFMGGDPRPAEEVHNNQSSSGPAEEQGQKNKPKSRGRVAGGIHKEAGHIFIETFDSHNRYILNLRDDDVIADEFSENRSTEEAERSDDREKEGAGQGAKKEGPRSLLRRKGRSNSRSVSKNRPPDKIFIPLKILSNRYEYADLVEATNNFSNDNRIAKGGNGVVYRGLLKGCLQVAIKVLKKEESNGFENEIIILSRYRHRNILSLLGYGVDEQYFYLVYEYAFWGDLRTLLFNHYYFYNTTNKKQKEKIAAGNMKKLGIKGAHLVDSAASTHGCNLSLGASPNQHLSLQQYQPLFITYHNRVNILVQIINVLCYLHTSSPIVYHRDLKSANILIDDKFNAKLGDFGLSFVYANGNNVFSLTGGTPGYADPYYITTHEINEQTEVYSFGALILEMLTSKSPAIHVGNNYSCIYTKNEDCPLHNMKRNMRREKSRSRSEADKPRGPNEAEERAENESTFDYLLNHINMNDYKSIYSVLDYSVNFPECLVEKLTKLSFLCLHPNIKTRPSSKLVNKIMLEIQKESDFFVRRQNEELKRRISYFQLTSHPLNHSLPLSNQLHNQQQHNPQQPQPQPQGAQGSREVMTKNSVGARERGAKEGGGAQRRVQTRASGKGPVQNRKSLNYSMYEQQLKECSGNSLGHVFFKNIMSLLKENSNEKVKKKRCNYSSEAPLRRRKLIKCNTIHDMGDIRQMSLFRLNNAGINPFSLNLLSSQFFKYICEYIHLCKSSTCLDREMEALQELEKLGGAEPSPELERQEEGSPERTPLRLCAKNKICKLQKTEHSRFMESFEAEMQKPQQLGSDDIWNKNGHTEMESREVYGGEFLGNKQLERPAQQYCRLFSGNSCRVNVSTNISDSNVDIIKETVTKEFEESMEQEARERQWPNVGKEGAGLKPKLGKQGMHPSPRYSKMCTDKKGRNYNGGVKNNWPPKRNCLNMGICRNQINNYFSGMGKESEPMSGSNDSNGTNRKRLTNSNCASFTPNRSLICSASGTHEKFGVRREAMQDRRLCEYMEKNRTQSESMHNAAEAEGSHGFVPENWKIERNTFSPVKDSGGAVCGSVVRYSAHGMIKYGVGMSVGPGEVHMNSYVFGTRVAGEAVSGSGNNNNSGSSNSNNYNNNSGNSNSNSNHRCIYFHLSNGVGSNGECGVLYISNYVDFLNCERNQGGNDANTFNWMNKNIFEISMDECTIASQLSYLDLLVEFNILPFKSYVGPTYRDHHQFLLGGRWVDPNSGECTDLQREVYFVNKKILFFFEVGLYQDPASQHYTLYLMKANQMRDISLERTEDSMKEKPTVRAWVSEYVGRRNEFVEAALKNKISGAFYECISRRHCQFVLTAQMHKLKKAPGESTLKGNWSFYSFEYSLSLYCNSENGVLSNSNILNKNYAYSYSLSRNILSLLVFSEEEYMRHLSQHRVNFGGGASPSPQQSSMYPLYPFFVNFNLYDN